MLLIAPSASLIVFERRPPITSMAVISKSVLFGGFNAKTFVSLLRILRRFRGSPRSPPGAGLNSLTRSTSRCRLLAAGFVIDLGHVASGERRALGRRMPPNSHSRAVGMCIILSPSFLYGNPPVFLVQRSTVRGCFLTSSRAKSLRYRHPSSSFGVGEDIDGYTVPDYELDSVVQFAHAARRVILVQNIFRFALSAIAPRLPVGAQCSANMPGGTVAILFHRFDRLLRLHALFCRLSRPLAAR